MLRKMIENDIKKSIGTLKDESSLLSVLKARLTKREYKLLLSRAEGLSSKEIQEKYKLDDKDFKELLYKQVKKLNQENIKQELVN